MDIKLIFKIIIIIIAILIVGCLLLFLFFNKVFGTKMSSDTIIKKFNDNKSLFEASQAELLGYDIIYINKNGDEISIFTQEQDGNKVNTVEIKQETFYKYEKSIELINKLNLISISNEHGNICFQFNSMINFGQYIVKMNNEEKYRWGNHVLNMENLGENWYYIETK